MWSTPQPPVRRVLEGDSQRFRSLNLTAHCYLVPRVRICGAIPLLPHIIFVVHKDRFTLTSSSTRAHSRFFSIKFHENPLHRSRIFTYRNMD